NKGHIDDSGGEKNQSVQRIMEAGCGQVTDDAYSLDKEQSKHGRAKSKFRVASPLERIQPEFINPFVHASSSFPK
ncbi:MAG: hypothetical protein ABI837_06685, partial [Acidobacteriota bacterium]